MKHSNPYLCLKNLPTIRWCSKCASPNSHTVWIRNRMGRMRAYGRNASAAVAQSKAIDSPKTSKDLEVLPVAPGSRPASTQSPGPSTPNVQKSTSFHSAVSSLPARKSPEKVFAR